MLDFISFLGVNSSRVQELVFYIVIQRALVTNGKETVPLYFTTKPHIILFHIPSLLHQEVNNENSYFDFNKFDFTNSAIVSAWLSFYSITILTLFPIFGNCRNTLSHSVSATSALIVHYQIPVIVNLINK